MRAFLATCALVAAAGGCAAAPAPHEAASPAHDKTATSTHDGTATSTDDGAAARARAGDTRPVSVPDSGTSDAAPGADVANPVRLRIPAIGVSTRVIPLRLDAGNRLIAPKQFDRVGWNKAGPEPGEQGVAVIAGHVDSTTGPAVFYRLRQLRKGDRVHVDRADGTTVTFVVNRLSRYPKNRIPDKEVYGSGGGTQLRLITCGGAFDRQRRSYQDNVIVFAG
ncbi:class F sortase [Nonomuraea turcica]|uniref:class F sortase n=1 Tax=Nonomuraea sp. G32 TaxID=3067274 RepID=UPI00273BD5F1|nr:class F sortase [Nonomuraea sp. G32]MDP4510803.1 class F sortase [Nonomuraea sp. G32]